MGNKKQRNKIVSIEKSQPVILPLFRDEQDNLKLLVDEADITGQLTRQRMQMAQVEANIARQRVDNYLDSIKNRRQLTDDRIWTVSPDFTQIVGMPKSAEQIAKEKAEKAEAEKQSAENAQKQQPVAPAQS